MPTVQPPPPPPPTTAVPPTGGAVAVAVKPSAEMRQALAGLRSGQPLQARQATPITAPPPPNPSQALPAKTLIQVQTQFGALTLQTAVPVPQGAQLTLVVNQLSPQLQFLITTLDGRSVTANAPPPPGAQAAVNGTATTPLSAGARFGATLLRTPSAPTLPQATAPTPQAVSPPPSPTPVSAPPGAAPNAPPVGTPSTTAPSPPAQSPPTTAPSPGSTSPSSPSPATAPASTSSTASSASSPTGASTPPPGSRFNVSLVRVIAANSPLNVPASAQSAGGGGLTAGATFSGLVSATTAQGQPIVQTPYGVFALDTRATAGEGTRLVFKIENGPSLPAIAENSRLGRGGPGENLSQAKSWAQLDEALKALAQSDAARFENFAQNTLPRPGAKLTTQMLFFLSALKGGDIRAWLGDTIGRIIERERPGSMSKLGGDFTTLSKLKDDPQPGDWRLALIPLWNGGELEQLRLYYRGRDDQEDPENDDDGTRFVLDLDLDNLGHIQLDGLMKAKAKRLDLIVRTDQQLPETWRVELAEIFTTAQDITAIQGTLAFQAAPGNFIAFAANESPTPRPGLLV